MHEIVLKSSERSFRISLAKTIEGATRGTRAKTADINFLTFVETLRHLVSATRSESKHFLIIDGLDDILLREPIQFDALASLGVEVSRINSTLQESGSPAKIVLLCRSDIYDRLPGSNLNKIRRDSAIELNWYSNPKHPERSNLVALSNAKARVTDPTLSDIFAAFFPVVIGYGKYDVPVRRYLLERTRHLPRDFLQLLKSVQETAGQSKSRLTEDVVRSAVGHYARTYFISEIRDELAGHLTVENRDLGLSALSRLRSTRFTMEDFTSAVIADSASFESEKFLGLLYDCGAVGNLRDNGYVAFRYRSPSVSFNPSITIILHRALSRAFNVPAG